MLFPPPQQVKIQYSPPYFPTPFRCPYYHSSYDTPDKLDFDSIVKVTTGIESVIADLTSEK
jgi:hypothetical protein